MYDIQADPGCLNDLSADPNYASALAELRQRLTRQLNDDGDPRLTGSGDVFDTYPRFGSMRLFDGFRERGKYNKAFDKHRAKETTDGLLDQQ